MANPTSAALLALVISCPASVCVAQRNEPAGSHAEGSDYATIEPPGAVYEGRAFQFHEVGEGVFHAMGTGELDVICNSTIIINDDDVMVVDSHVTPAAAWALRQELKRITDKPIRFVVNTHFHYDHSHGNQSFGKDVEIIGHEFTRQAMLEGMSQGGLAYGRFMEGIPERINGLKDQLANAAESDRAQLEKQLRIAESHQQAAASVRAKPPTTTFRKQLTMHRGSREIRLMYFGRGHTGGDVVVYLPQDRLLITGDLVLPGPSYMGNAFVPEWVHTLEGLKSLEFDTIVPGHGAAFSNPKHLDNLQAYYRDFWQKAVAAHERGTPAEEAADQISMYNHAENFGGRMSRSGVDVHAVKRVYQLLDSGYEPRKP